MMACRQEKTTNRSAEINDSMRIVLRQDSINLAKEDSVDKEQTICTFIKRLYHRELYNNDSFLLRHCTERFIIDAHKEQAVIGKVFRSSMQNDNSKPHIVNVSPIGNNWFRYELYDRGRHAENEIKVYMKSNRIYIDSIRHKYDEAQAHGKPRSFTKQ